MTLVACAIIHERDKLKAIGFEQVKPTILYTDSQSSVDLCKTLLSKENTKHINVRINFLRECVNNPIIEIVFIKTDLMVTDVLTKPLAKNIFNQLKFKLLYGFVRTLVNTLLLWNKSTEKLIFMMQYLLVKSELAST